jgi:hypothetical protein
MLFFISSATRVELFHPVPPMPHSYQRMPRIQI